MLRPTALTLAQYALATKPSLGYEQQLFISTQQAVSPGMLLCVGANSGIYTASVSDTAMLFGAPQELLCVLDTDISDTADIVISVTGTDASGAALTGTATFTPPAYVNEQARVFPKGYAVEIVPTVDGKLWKTITNVAIVATGAAQFAQFKFLGLPSLASYKKIGLKVSLEYDAKTPMPTAVQEGRDMGKYIKPGNIEVGTASITGKIATQGDGIARYNGVRVTGLIKEVKEDKVGTMNIFLAGLILNAKVKTAEDQSPNTLEASAMFETLGFVMAPGLGQ